MVVKQLYVETRCKYVERKCIYVDNDDWLAHISSGKLSGYCDLIGKLMLKGE